MKQESRQNEQSKIQLKRSVKVKKFDPHHVCPTHIKSVTAVNSKQHVPNGYLGPQSSHIEITPTDMPAPRWPPKPLKRKDIESKPWYLWTMEETTEYYMGDQIRAERYGTYNPSFVKKLSDDKPTPNIAFGYKAGSSSNADTGKNRKSDSQLPQSRSAQRSSSNMDSATVITSNTSNNRSNNKKLHDEVESEIRTRRLKYTDLLNEIDEVRRQTEELELKGEQEYTSVQASITAADRSDEELKNAEIKAMQVIAATRLGVNKILQHRQGQQESLREMVERQKESFRRMSIRDAAGKKIDTDTFLKQYNDIQVPEFKNPTLNESNMGKYLQKLDSEKRKEQVRAAVIRGLKKFAAMQKLKKKNQTGKKTLKLTAVTVNVAANCNINSLESCQQQEQDRSIEVLQGIDALKCTIPIMLLVD